MLLLVERISNATLSQCILLSVALLAFAKQGGEGKVMMGNWSYPPDFWKHPFEHDDVVL